MKRFFCTGLMIGLTIASQSWAWAQNEHVDLEKAFEKAASADQQTLKNLRGKDANLAASKQAEDPLARFLSKETLGNEMNPALSLILDMVGSYFSTERRLDQGEHVPALNGIALTSLELAASANIDPYFRLDLALNFAHMELEEAYFTTLSLPWNLQVRGGQFLTKLGRQNATHPHRWHFVLHPLPSQFLFGAEGLGAPGLEVSWLAPLPWYAELISAIQIGEGGSVRTKSLSGGDPRFSDFLYPLRLVQFFDISDDWAFQVGLNTLLAPSSMGSEVGKRVYIYGSDFFLKWRPIGFGQTGYTFVSWLAEVWFREMEVPQDRWRDMGGYTDLIFGISKRWEAGLRLEFWRRLKGLIPYMNNDRELFGLNQERFSSAITFMPSHFSRLRIQYTFESLESYAHNHLTLLQLEVSAGAHGAHSY